MSDVDRFAELAREATAKQARLAREFKDRGLHLADSNVSLWVFVALCVAVATFVAFQLG